MGRRLLEEMERLQDGLLSAISSGSLSQMEGMLTRCAGKSPPPPPPPSPTCPSPGPGNVTPCALRTASPVLRLFGPEQAVVAQAQTMVNAAATPDHVRYLLGEVVIGLRAGDNKGANSRAGEVLRGRLVTCEEIGLAAAGCPLLERVERLLNRSDGIWKEMVVKQQVGCGNW
jgi:hypothetical protein